MRRATASRKELSWAMSDYLVILLVVLLAVAGAAWWVIPVGAAALSIEPWFQQWRNFKQYRGFHSIRR